MKTALIQLIQQLNPWLDNHKSPILDLKTFVERAQANKLLLPEWDGLWLVLTGPRQAGKTTLAKYLALRLIQEQRFSNLLYLNCDYLEIRNWLKNTAFIYEIKDQLGLQQPILLIDEVQRLENPGLLLKMIADLKLPIKMIATGSSQLEMKSKVQEFLTGRHLESIILPFSFLEINRSQLLDEMFLYGGYPKVIQSTEKKILLQQLYNDYISKDIIEILKVGKPDVMQKLITLMAHSSGQLINYNQLSNDCQVSVTLIHSLLDILEKTFVLMAIRPFVGNKRSEITSNPIYYFLDNGFRNQALKNFSPLENRSDIGLLIENFVFQELYKFKTQNFSDFSINFWRTKSGAEVDFVLHQNLHNILPIEVKFSHFDRPNITKAYRSFLQAYRPKQGIIITKDFIEKIKVEDSIVHFIPLEHLTKTLNIIQKTFP